MAFTSWATDLVDGDSDQFADIFVRDTIAGTTTLVSVGADGSPANNHSENPDISADGSTVVFQSGATNLDPEVPPTDPFQHYHVYSHDLATGVTRLVSRTPAGEYPDLGSYRPSVSADGALVAFDTLATDIVSGGHQYHDVVLHDVAAASSMLVSRPPTGQPNGESFAPSISSDGTTIGFSSTASNLVSGDTNGTYDVFAYVVESDEMTMITRSTTGGATNEWSDAAEVNANGRYIVFHSLASNLVLGDSNGFLDAFLHDTTTGTTTLLSRNAAGKSGDGNSSTPSVSGDGSVATYTSQASDLIRRTRWVRPGCSRTAFGESAPVSGGRTSAMRPTLARMTNNDTPWEPPLAGTESEHLLGALDRLRTTFRWKADDLDAGGLQTRIGASSLTLGGLLKHLASWRTSISRPSCSGEPMGAPWDATGWDG